MHAAFESVESAIPFVDYAFYRKVLHFVGIPRKHSAFYHNTFYRKCKLLESVEHNAMKQDTIHDCVNLQNKEIELVLLYIQFVTVNQLP